MYHKLSTGVRTSGFLPQLEGEYNITGGTFIYSECSCLFSLIRPRQSCQISQWPLSPCSTACANVMSLSTMSLKTNSPASIYNEAQEVIYRAKLQGVDANDCSNLTSHIREWMEASSSLLIQGNRLSLNPTCDLEIETLVIQPACVIGETPPSPTTSSPNNSLPIEVIIGGAGAGGIIILLLLALVVAVCCICCRRREKPDRYS